MTERLEAMFKEPCDGEIGYSEIRNGSGARILLAVCACGKEVGSHLLQDASEIRHAHCERVYTREDAIEGMSETLLCHRKGVWYDAYMGFWEDGEEMTEEEYAPVRERLGL